VVKKKTETKEDKKNLGLQDVIAKVVSIGVGAAFMTEDAVKNIVGDLPLPKDIVSGLVQNAKGAKEEFAAQIREEVKNHLDKINPNKLLEEVIEKYDVEVTAKFKFKKKNSDED
jgi:polyhydroxyalkanoate synthesis regulator phasin